LCNRWDVVIIRVYVLGKNQLCDIFFNIFSLIRNFVEEFKKE